MKVYNIKLIFILATILTILSCSTKHDRGFKIAGTVEAEDGTMIHLAHSTTKYEVLDSCEVKNNSFQFTSEEVETDRYFLRSRAFSGIDLVLEPGSDLEVVISKAVDYQNDYQIKVNKGREQELLNRYEDFVKSELESLEDFRERENKHINYILQNPEGMAAVIAADNVMIVNHKQMESIFAVIDTVSYSHTNSYRGAAKKRAELSHKWMVGKTAPDFTAPDINGKEHSLADFKGKYVLLDFWASWCAPCRIKNKEVAEHLEKLKELNIEMISYSLDEERDLWEKGSKDDGISWLNLSELTGLQDNGAAKDYRVTNLPTIFFINPEGVIISQNPSLKEILSGNMTPESDALFN